MRPSTRTRAAGRLGDAGDQLQRGALARAVPADHAVGRALRHRERHVGQRRKRLARLQIAQDAALQQRALQRRELPAAVAAVDLGDVDELDRRRHHRLAQTNRAAGRTASSRPGTAAPSRRRAPAATSSGRPDPVKNRISWYETARCVNGLRSKNVLELLHARLEPRIDDRRREEPQRQQVRQDVADVAEVHGQRRQDQRQRRR